MHGGEGLVRLVDIEIGRTRRIETGRCELLLTGLARRAPYVLADRVANLQKAQVTHDAAAALERHGVAVRHSGVDRDGDALRHADQHLRVDAAIGAGPQRDAGAVHFEPAIRIESEKPASPGPSGCVAR